MQVVYYFIYKIRVQYLYWFDSTEDREQTQEE